MRWICGVFRTTPVATLQVETAIWPLSKRMKGPIQQRLTPNWRKDEPANQPEHPVPIQKQRRRDWLPHDPPTRLWTLANRDNSDGEPIFPFQQPLWHRSILNTDLQDRVKIRRAKAQPHRNRCCLQTPQSRTETPRQASSCSSIYRQIASPSSSSQSRRWSDDLLSRRHG